LGGAACPESHSGLTLYLAGVRPGVFVS
jgi:hypothetical protein